MKLIEEMSYDLDFNDPKLIISEKLAVIENVKAIVMISETSLTVLCRKETCYCNRKRFCYKRNL